MGFGREALIRARKLANTLNGGGESILPFRAITQAEVYLNQMETAGRVDFQAPGFISFRELIGTIGAVVRAYKPNGELNLGGLNPDGVTAFQTAQMALAREFPAIPSVALEP